MKEDNIIFGLRPIIEAIKAGKEAEKLLIRNGLQSELYFELKELIKIHQIPFQYVPIEKLNRITRKNHQGLICFISPVNYVPLENIIPLLFEEGKTPLLLILDKITDVRNLGAIARTAECAGVNAIIIPSRGSALIGPDAIKTSAGALFKIPLCRSANLKETIAYLKECGIRIISCSEKGENFYYQADFTNPSAIILGSEEDGISPEYLKLSDTIVKIPLHGEIESLNVSVASGIVLFEALKQRAL